MTLKNRSAYKGLIARGLNYLFQKDKLDPKYDHTKFNQLIKGAKAAKAKGQYYVAMLSWAEADRLSEHSRFDEVLKEVTALNQNVGQECGCTVDAPSVSSNLKKEIEQKLYTVLPVTGLPGKCKIQTFQVNIPAGGKRDELIASARQQAAIDRAATFITRENDFQQTMLAKASGVKSSPDEEFAVGEAARELPGKDAVAVADVELPGVKKKSFTSEKGQTVEKNIVEPISQTLAQKFAAKIKAAQKKIASSDLVAKVDGLITKALYGDDPERQNEYESLHEQQFGRRTPASGAMGAVFAY